GRHPPARGQRSPDPRHRRRRQGHRARRSQPPRSIRLARHARARAFARRHGRHPGRAGQRHSHQRLAAARARGEQPRSELRTMIRVVIADDHAIVRQGLRQILATHGDFEVVGEAANHGEVMQLLRRGTCDVLLLDIAMPGKNGIDTLKQVRVEKPKLPVLVLSMYPEDQYAFRALKAGASGYLTKMTAADQLVDAIRTITRGRKYITPELAQSLAESFD